VHFAKKGQYQNNSGRQNKEREEVEGNTHNFTHVQNDNGAFKSDTKTGNNTTTDDGSERVDLWASDHLDNDTDDVDEATCDDGPFAANSIGDIASHDCAKEGTSGQNRDNKR
jgi:hypothetical protein